VVEGGEEIEMEVGEYAAEESREGEEYVREEEEQEENHDYVREEEEAEGEEEEDDE